MVIFSPTWGLTGFLPRLHWDAEGEGKGAAGLGPGRWAEPPLTRLLNSPRKP